MNDTREPAVPASGQGGQGTTSPLVVAAAWALVGVPLAYGLWRTLVTASQLFVG